MKDLIPARGTVEFLLHPMEDREFLIDGPKGWARPAVGLMLPSYYDEREIARSMRAENLWMRHLPFEPVVVDEVGCLLLASDYLGYVISEEPHSEDGSYFYRPHIDGPVSDAPRVHRFQVKPPRATA